MKSSRNNLDLTTGSVSRKLIAFTMPILASNLLQHLYNAADRAVVGQFAENGDLALAAVGSTGSAISLMLNLFVGMALGANVVCSNLRGAVKPKELRKAMHTSILLAAICGIAMAVAGMLVAKPFLRLMESPDSVIDYATLYLRIYFVGVPFSLLYNFGSAILRSHGDTKRPMIILALSGLVNVVLNLVFVIFFRMDVDGVAWATVISQAVSAVAVLRILFKPDGGFDLNIKELKLHKREISSITRVGIPCGLNGIVFSISNVILQSSVNSLGDVVMAGVAAANGCTGLIFQILASFSSACISFSGQCFGARQYKRIDKLVGRSILLSSVMTAALAALVTLFPRFFLGLFTNNQSAMKHGVQTLVVVSWSYMIYGVSEIFLAALRGMRHSGMPTILNACCVCLPRLVWILAVFPLNREVGFLHLCYPISYVISATAQGLYFHWVRKKLDREERLAIQ